MIEIKETEVTLLSRSSRLQGDIEFRSQTRVHGQIRGRVLAGDAPIVVLGEQGVIEGDIVAKHLVIDGYVRGNIKASEKVVVSSTGRVIGNITSPSIEVAFGAFFEGECFMQKNRPESTEKKKDTKPPSGRGGSKPSGGKRAAEAAP